VQVAQFVVGRAPGKSARTVGIDGGAEMVTSICGRPLV
jgi:hypothetical protein